MVWCEASEVCILPWLMNCTASSAEGDEGSLETTSVEQYRDREDPQDLSNEIVDPNFCDPESPKSLASYMPLNGWVHVRWRRRKHALLLLVR